MNSELSQGVILEAEISGFQNAAQTDHSKLENLDYEHSGHTGFQPAGDYVEDSDYVHTDNNYTTEDKSKLASLENYDDTDIKSEINDIKLSYSLKTETGSVIEVDINSSTYVMTINLKNSAGTVLSTDNIDLPLETMVIGASYDSATKEIVLTLKNGNTIRFSVADLVSGLQTEITSTNKLDSSLVDDSLSDNKFVTPTEKATWNNKSDFSGDYDDLTNKPTIPTVPSNVSAFTNDSNYQNATQVQTAINNAVGNINTVLATLTTVEGE